MRTETFQLKEICCFKLNRLILYYNLLFLYDPLTMRFIRLWRDYTV
jgi:hypothetical protein